MLAIPVLKCTSDRAQVESSECRGRGCTSVAEDLVEGAGLFVVQENLVRVHVQLRQQLGVQGGAAGPGRVHLLLLPRPWLVVFVRLVVVRPAPTRSWRFAGIAVRIVTAPVSVNFSYTQSKKVLGLVAVLCTQECFRYVTAGCCRNVAGAAAL